MLQVPGGWLCRKIGGKTVFGLGVLVPSIVTIATPFSTQYFPLFICARVLTGLGESATYVSSFNTSRCWLVARRLRDLGSADMQVSGCTCYARALGPVT